MASRAIIRPAPERPSWYISPRDITDRSANPIGRGGFGEVFTGTYFGSKVAIKQLLGNYNNRELADYNHEIDIWKQLSHPHILPLLGACDKDDDGNPIPPFMVSPFMPNGTLRNHVANNNVPLEEKLRLLFQAASALAYLHSRRIIHGDLKALNILLDGLNNAVVTDFGMSRTKHTSASLDRNRSMGPTGGTDGYIAPEMLDDDDPSGSTMKTDVYAFAITMYEVLNDAKPVWVTNNGQAMLNRAIERISCNGKRPKRLDGIPDDIWALIKRCWAQDPAARPAFPDILAVLQPYNRATVPAIPTPAAAKTPPVSQVVGHFTTLSVNSQPPSQSSRPDELKFDGIESATRLPTSIVSLPPSSPAPSKVIPMPVSMLPSWSQWVSLSATKIGSSPPSSTGPLPTVAASKHPSSWPGSHSWARGWPRTTAVPSCFGRKSAPSQLTLS
ncbi:kinase-like domain-containing protein [Polychytrium aggregatum]|uniref:kinase-like domain-containing protein n=1 Tax=Polychytrium aggregatum TaxID=110093 RepID=UPI0022FE74B5|nr:kinase-like domain-containing protein [Polychytrium aggregatum]KAI9201970.1 kinase-like domain-containing protein [Polychytrium aggregatum]